MGSTAWSRRASTPRWTSTGRWWTCHRRDTHVQHGAVGTFAATSLSAEDWREEFSFYGTEGVLNYPLRRDALPDEGRRHDHPPRPGPRRAPGRELPRRHPRRGPCAPGPAHLRPARRPGHRGRATSPPAPARPNELVEQAPHSVTDCETSPAPPPWRGGTRRCGAARRVVQCSTTRGKSGLSASMRGRKMSQSISPVPAGALADVQHQAVLDDHVLGVPADDEVAQRVRHVGDGRPGVVDGLLGDPVDRVEVAAHHRGIHRVRAPRPSSRAEFERHQHVALHADEGLALLGDRRHLAQTS